MSSSGDYRLGWAREFGVGVGDYRLGGARDFELGLQWLLGLGVLRLQPML